MYDKIVESPNHGPVRAKTTGIILHSTRGGASTVEREYIATINWFMTPASEVSAHTVISYAGEITRCVDEDYIAWHARDFNYTHLGVELVQPNRFNPISEQQYTTLAKWCIAMAKRYDFPLNERTLREHKDINIGKSDIDYPFTVHKLLRYIHEEEQTEMLSEEDKNRLLQIAGGLDIWSANANARAQATVNEYGFNDNLSQRQADEFGAFAQQIREIVEAN